MTAAAGHQHRSIQGEGEIVGEHEWTEHDDGYQFCGRCGLFEWLAELGSKCSGVQGVAAEAEGWSAAL
ncbi:hypothetical protein ACQHIV_42235 (plasmid) [Kribbella sp. GL6]|uniref:hypothetical protein n=1 Tax=Kribbella sp. GL6 TaxID=3419765 RepID=UPI003D01CC55